MKRAVFAGLAALAACASPAVDPDLAFALGQDVTCNAGDHRAANGEASTLYISLFVPDRGGGGEFCIATGCEAATYEPTLTRAQGWTAIMRTNDRTAYNATLEISRDLRTFTLRERDGAGWSGTCSAAGS
ncbi:MAG: hypothetical protein AB7Q23_12450 [Hyphomonadaceae bacterium]